MSQYYSDEETRKLLDLMLMTVGLVLLVACANAANMMLVRTLSRSRDLVVRLTLGASRARVAMLLLGQSLILTLLATLLALPLAQAGVSWVVHAFDGTDDGPPPWMDFSIDAGMALMAIAMGLVGLRCSSACCQCCACAPMRSPIRCAMVVAAWSAVASAS